MHSDRNAKPDEQKLVFSRPKSAGCGQERVDVKCVNAECVPMGRKGAVGNGHRVLMDCVSVKAWNVFLRSCLRPLVSGSRLRPRRLFLSAFVPHKDMQEARIRKEVAEFGEGGGGGVL